MSTTFAGVCWPIECMTPLAMRLCCCSQAPLWLGHLKPVQPRPPIPIPLRPRRLQPYCDEAMHLFNHHPLAFLAERHGELSAMVSTRQGCSSCCCISHLLTLILLSAHEHSLEESSLNITDIQSAILATSWRATIKSKLATMSRQAVQPNWFMQ